MNLNPLTQITVIMVSVSLCFVACEKKESSDGKQDASDKELHTDDPIAHYNTDTPSATDVTTTSTERGSGTSWDTVSDSYDDTTPSLGTSTVVEVDSRDTQVSINTDGRVPTDTDTGTSIQGGTESDTVIETVPTQMDAGEVASDTDVATDSQTSGSSGHEDAGEPEAVLDELVNLTYVLDIETRDWSSPVPVNGTAIYRYIPTFAFHVTAVQGSDLHAVFGTTTDGAQDPCNEAKSVNINVAENPNFRLDTDTLQVIVAGPDNVAELVTITDVSIKGSFSEDGLHFTGLFDAVLDVREVADLFYQVLPPVPENICDQIVNVTPSAKCTACDDGEPFCTPLKAKNILASAVTELPLVAQPADVAGCLPAQQK